ncbi:hypothetical protein MBLNU230_g3155t1 [Neophaeotheca triangularis]
MSKPLLPLRQTAQNLSSPLRRRRTLYNPFHNATPHSPPRCRTFASTTQRQSAQTKRPQMKQRSQPSMALAEKQQREAMMKTEGLPDDLGILPGTFIMPPWSERPGMFQNPRGRWKLEKARAKARFWDAIANLVFKYVHVRPRPSLHTFQLPAIATKLHKSLYSAFAAGNLTAVEPSLCQGFLLNLRNALAQRKSNHFYTFTVVRELSRPRLMSVRGAVLPGKAGEGKGERNGALQAVVRVHTLQRAQEMRRKQVRGPKGLRVEEEAVGEAVEKAQVDYFVVQRVLRKSRYGPWKVFGHAKPTTLRELEKEEEGKRERDAKAKLAG